MNFDAETTSLRFTSLEEADALHTELTELLRRAMASAHEGVSDPEQAKELSHGVMKCFRTTMQALNAMRRKAQEPASDS